MADEGGGRSTRASAQNGELHPPTSESRVLSTPGKRKRANHEESSAQDANSAEPQEKLKLQEMLRDVVEILNRCVCCLVAGHLEIASRSTANKY